MVNLLPTLESPVTRQEKMATVWDEAEVRAGGSGARAAGRPRWREGRRWLRGQGRARSRDWGRLACGRGCILGFLAHSGSMEAEMANSQC